MADSYDPLLLTGGTTAKPVPAPNPVNAADYTSQFGQLYSRFRQCGMQLYSQISTVTLAGSAGEQVVPANNTRIAFILTAGVLIAQSMLPEGADPANGGLSATNPAQNVFAYDDFGPLIQGAWINVGISAGTYNLIEILMRQ